MSVMNEEVRPDLADIMYQVERTGELDSSELEACEEYVEEIMGVSYASTLSPDDLVERFRDLYQGWYDSETAFAEQLMYDTGELDQMPAHLRYYFDYEAFGRDLFLGDYTMTSGGHVFLMH